MSEPSSKKRVVGPGAKHIPAEQIIARCISQRTASSVYPLIIAVGGPGGVGKSIFSRAIADSLPDTSIVTLDDYRLPRSVREGRGLLGSHPDANDIDAIRNHIHRLREGSAIDKPVYDPVKGESTATETVDPARVIILDGEISTYNCLMDVIDLSVYMDSDWRTQLQSRLSRDVGDHQFSPEKALSTFLQSNFRDTREFGEPGRERADIRLFVRADYGVDVEFIRPELLDETELSQPWVEADFQGLIVPVMTPFREDLAIDETAFIRHLEWLGENGVERVLIGGTLGEFFSLAHDEGRRLLRLTRKHFGGVITFQAGRENRFRTVEEITMAEDNGADALVVLTPYFYADVGESGLIDYFLSVVESARVPLILYNFTRHTQNTLTGKVLKAIPHFGLKDSDANLDLLPYTPRYYLGSDTGMVEAYAAGAFGFVSGSANFLPSEYVALERSLKSGGADAQALQETVDRGVARSSGANSIVRIKTMLTDCVPGYPAYVRPPLTHV